MGNFFSKTLVTGENKNEVEEEKPPTTPILSTKFRNLDELDPRSPSTNVTRTPIQVVLSSLDSAKKEPLTEAKLPEKLHNKNLDNVRKTLITSTNKENAYPKLLKSSPITPKPENKRHSLVGLLETNLDCPETNLDMVIESKFCGFKNIDPRSPSTDFIRTPLRIYEDKNDVVENLEEEEVKSDDGLIEKISKPKESNIVEPNNKEEFQLFNDEFKTTNDELQLNNDEVQITNDEVQISHHEVLLKNDEVQITDDEVNNQEISSTSVEPNKLDNGVSEVDLKSQIISESIENLAPNENILRKVETGINLTPVSTPINKKIKNEARTSSIRKINEFSKKLNNIIKEEENENPVPKSILSTNNRTPLGDRNGQKKTIPKLKVSDKPRRQDYAVSKIPLYKHKKNSENIPPAMNKNDKLKIKWDNENTLII